MKAFSTLVDSPNQSLPCQLLNPQSVVKLVSKYLKPPRKKDLPRSTKQLLSSVPTFDPFIMVVKLRGLIADVVIDNALETSDHWFESF
jgi:hypothetical protein